jgi:hypothetical protein
MRARPFLLLAFLMLCAAGARAEPAAPSSAGGGCVVASVEIRVDASAWDRYRIVFLNRCSEARNLYWCAQSPGASVPPALACARGRGFPAEPRHRLVQRKEFQWHLPRGTRIRYHDCGGQELPTADFGCAAP